MSPISNERELDLVSHSVAQTQRLGARLGELARAGDLFCLEGDLGSGKTCFAQGLGRGLGILESIHSPTFILANEHRGGRLPLFHLDLYRIRGTDEAIGIGLDDYLTDEGVCVIEWAEKIRGALPPEHLWIIFRHLTETKRSLLIEACGARYEELLDAFKTHAFGLESNQPPIEPAGGAVQRGRRNAAGN
ncbi:MAG: tRNA (adenosine(37)-N6)-threonylcarbamoyltransferase complex ATPase subunit type 1 TsaE [Chloroflexota bacterium]|nr:tRNA (adenosine(37)-N6)-threonylcarbamoyltransferase complex ATPase subunit type 1 TsaE [Chloroflexota bacterium]